MRRGKLWASLIGLLTLGWTAPAAAQDIGEGSLILGVDRLFGYGSSKTEIEFDGGADADSEASGFSLGTPLLTPGGPPRVGLDYVVADPITVGGAFGFATESDDDDNETSVTAWALAPRVGGWFQLSELIALWPRAGITVFHQNSTTDTPPGDVENSFTVWQLNLEGWLAITPVANVALLAGLYFDAPIGGSGTSKAPGTPDVDYDISIRTFGVSTGVAVAF